MAVKPDYGIDAPGVVRNLILIGAGLIGASFFFQFIHIGPARIALGRMMVITGCVLVAEGILMVVYAKVGKFRHRDRMLAMIDWRGNEDVLDVGTGRGVLLIGAAKRISSGKAIGIDIWSGKDLSGNRMEATLQNAELEGVRGRIELMTEDASKMSFADGSFDVIVSNLCLHNIEDRAARSNACREIARVLKPGGCAVISDFKHVAEYGDVFAAAGLAIERYGPYLFDTFPPLRVVKAHKRH